MEARPQPGRANSAKPSRHNPRFVRLDAGAVTERHLSRDFVRDAGRIARVGRLPPRAGADFYPIICRSFPDDCGFWRQRPRSRLQRRRCAAAAVSESATRATASQAGEHRTGRILPPAALLRRHFQPVSDVPGGEADRRAASVFLGSALVRPHHAIAPRQDGRPSQSSIGVLRSRRMIVSTGSA